MFDRIKTRLSSEEGFTLIELLVVIIILGILIAIAVPAYLSLTGKANSAAASANVRSAIPAAESYYEANGSYSGLTPTTLAAQASGVKVADVTVSADGNAYCLDDTSGTTNAYYIGGDQTYTAGAGTGFGFKTLAATAKLATIEAGTGAAGSADLCADASVGATNAS